MNHPNFLRRNFTIVQVRSFWRQIEAAEDECAQQRRPVRWLIQPGELANPIWNEAGMRVYLDGSPALG